MLQEVIIVEGKSDITQVKKAIDAEIIATGGFALNQQTLEKINIAYEKKGIIILTDPDYAGEKIRKTLARKFPFAKHAFIAQEDAFFNGDIGVEQASIETIQNALAKIKTHTLEPKNIFFYEDLYENQLTGGNNSAFFRNKLGKILGIGYTNAKNFLVRLNTYGISREEFICAIKKMNDTYGDIDG